MSTINLAKRLKIVLIRIFFVRHNFMSTINLAKRFKNILIRIFLFVSFSRVLLI